VSPSVTSTEIISEVLKKQKINNLSESYAILLVTRDKTVVLSSDDQPLQVQNQLSKNGLKFGGTENYFRFCAKKDVPPGAVMRLAKSQSPYNRQTLQIPGSPPSSSSAPPTIRTGHTFVGAPSSINNNRIHSTPFQQTQKSFVDLHNNARPKTMAEPPSEPLAESNTIDVEEKPVVTPPRKSIEKVDPEPEPETESESFIQRNIRLFSQNPNQSEDSYLAQRPLPTPKPKTPAKQTYAQTVMNNVQPQTNRPSNASSRPVILVPKTTNQPQTRDRAITPGVPVKVAIANYQANFQNRRV